MNTESRIPKPAQDWFRFKPPQVEKIIISNVDYQTKPVVTTVNTPQETKVSKEEN